jgi:ADP-ribose pyrophosphatase
MKNLFESPEVEERRERLVTGPVFDVEARYVKVPSGETVKFVTVEHPGAVVIVAQDQAGRLVIERQWRRAAERYLLEIPAGTLERGEDPLACAQRELKEETGFIASSWEPLGVLYPCPGFCTERQFGFFASGLILTETALDEDEHIETSLLFPREFEEAVGRGDVQDGKSLAFYTLAKVRGLIS